MTFPHDDHALPPRHGTKLALCPVFLVVVLSSLLAGCSGSRDLDQKGANQSLVEIGERSIEQAENMEDDGLASEANISYKRALWAFRYHQHLTGEEPLLLDEALEGVRRTARQFSKK